MGRNIEAYNYSFAWVALRIICSVKYIGLDAYYVKAFDIVFGSLNKMNCFRSQQDTELIKRVEMTKNS